jgi:hypothetical protein
MQVHPLVPEPTLLAGRPPKAYAAIFPNGIDVKAFRQKAAEHKIEILPLGESALLVLSLDAPDYTLRWLRALSPDSGKILLVELSSYYVID